MEKVYGYLSHQLGFSEFLYILINEIVKPKLTAMGIIVLDPFEECVKELDFSVLGKLTKHSEVISFWEEFNDKVAPINNELMKISHCFLGILEGSHAIDDGQSSEIGYYACLNQGPIFALRSDLRGGENIASPINPQILGYIKQTNGYLARRPNAFEKWCLAIEKWKKTLK